MGVTIKNTGPAAPVIIKDTAGSGYASQVAADRVLAQTAATNAAAFAPSPNTASLIAAIRTNGVFPQPITRAAAVDIPTVTIGAADAASTLNAQGAGGATVDKFDAKIMYLCGPVSLAAAGYPGNMYARGRGAYYGAVDAVPNPFYQSYYMSYEFNHTGTSFEIPITGQGGAGNEVTLYCDDILVYRGATPNTGSLYFVKFVFGSSRLRRIRFEASSCSTNGVNVVSTGEVTATGRSYPLITVMGDSFVEGTGAAPANDSEPIVMAHALGARALIAGVGGTALLEPGGNNVAGFPKVVWTNTTRLEDLTLVGATDSSGASVVPAMGVVCLSINDYGVTSAKWNGAANYYEAIKKAVFTVIDAWYAANPGKPLAIFGPTSVNDSTAMDLYRMRDAAEEACLAFQSKNVRFFDRFEPGPLLRKGTVDYTATTGTTVNGNAQITGLASVAGIIVGSDVYGAGIQTRATVMSVDSGTAVTLSHTATASAVGVALIFKNSHAAHYTNVQASDVTHPDLNGHSLDGRWMARQLRGWIMGELA